MKVLIIEDDLIWQCKLQIIAERAKLDIVSLSATIAEAEQVLQIEDIDLIIADIHLNGENIFTLLRNDAYRDIPTILITASEKREDFLKSKKLSNSVFLVKPFHHHTLLSAISSIKSSGKDSMKVSNAEIRRFYKLIGDNNIIDLFKLEQTESYILIKRWREFETFTTIGKDLKLSGQRIQRMYEKIINKIRQKTLSNLPKYKEYLEITKHKKNRIEILKDSVAQKVDVAKTINIKTSIDSFDNLNTKWKNVLLDKNIKTVEDLVQYSKRELLMFNKLGKFAVLEIEKALNERGFQLKD